MYRSTHLTFKAIFPDSKDQAFSEDLWAKIVDLVLPYGATRLSLEISEQYDTETEPHYAIHYASTTHLSAVPPVGINSTGNYEVEYDATADGETYHGVVRICIIIDLPCDSSGILLRRAFSLYAAAIREHYPEWETVYDEENEQFSVATRYSE